jgi:hypothetical protein
MIQSPRNKSLMGKSVGAYHVEDYDSTNFTRRNKSKWSNVGGALDGGGVGASARPIRNLYRGEGYVWLTGTTSGGGRGDTNWQQVGVLDVRAKMDTSDWGTGGNNFILNRVFNANGRRHFRFGHRSNRLLSFQGANSTGTALSEVFSTVAVPAGFVGWMRATWDPFAEKVNFYTSPNGDDWTQLGVEVDLDLDGAPPVITTATRLLFGGRAGGSDTPGAENARGKLYKFQVFDGATLIANFDANLCGQTGYTDISTSPAFVWVIERNTSGLKTAVVNKLTGSHALYGTDKFAEVGYSSVLSPGATSWTGAVLARRFGNPPSTQNILGDKPDTGVGMGWRISYGSTGIFFNQFADGSAALQQTLAYTFTTNHLISLVIDSNNRTFRVDGSFISGPRAAVGAIDSGNPLQIGRVALGGFADVEESFTAVFRHALTSTDLTRLKWEAETFARKF